MTIAKLLQKYKCPDCKKRDRIRKMSGYLTKRCAKCQRKVRRKYDDMYYEKNREARLAYWREYNKKKRIAAKEEST